MILKHKSKTNDPKAVQALNTLLGHAALRDYTADTVAAVKLFQQAYGLKVDGIAGPDTLGMLVYGLPSVDYKDYSGSKYVRAVQALVGAEVDGKYGVNTRANVMAFQAAAGLEMTGNISPVEWKALFDLPYVRIVPESAGKQPVDYKQGDKRWKSKPYTATKNKSQTIGSSGCGPTSMADIMATYKDKSITPVEMCAYALKHGYRTANSGTAWGFFGAIAKAYKFSKFVQTKSLATLRSALAGGAVAVASMGPGYWTKGGHFICVYKMDGTYVFANDPASTTRKKQKIADFERQRKQFFIFWA